VSNKTKRPRSRFARRMGFAGDPQWCHICGMQIPETDVSSEHPLSGTIDHVLPLAHGGKNIVSNRRRAHRQCNFKKGNRVVIPPYDVRTLQLRAAECLERLGLPGGPVEIRNGAIRVNLAPKRSYPARGAPHMIQRWEDDGGRCAQY
jgi:HNH endonuclease